MTDDMDAVQDLLKMGTPIDTQDVTTGNTILHGAAKGGPLARHAALPKKQGVALHRATVKEAPLLAVLAAGVKAGSARLRVIEL